MQLPPHAAVVQIVHLLELNYGWIFERYWSHYVFFSFFSPLLSKPQLLMTQESEGEKLKTWFSGQCHSHCCLGCLFTLGPSAQALGQHQTELLTAASISFSRLPQTLQVQTLPFTCSCSSEPWLWTHGCTLAGACDHSDSSVAFLVEASGHSAPPALWRGPPQRSPGLVLAEGKPLSGLGGASFSLGVRWRLGCGKIQCITDVTSLKTSKTKRESDCVTYLLKTVPRDSYSSPLKSFTLVTPTCLPLPGKSVCLSVCSLSPLSPLQATTPPPFPPWRVPKAWKTSRGGRAVQSRLDGRSEEADGCSRATVNNGSWGREQRLGSGIWWGLSAEGSLKISGRDCFHSFQHLAAELWGRCWIIARGLWIQASPIEWTNVSHTAFSCILIL